MIRAFVLLATFGCGLFALPPRNFAADDFKFNVDSNHGPSDLFQGDIMLTEAQKAALFPAKHGRGKRQAIDDEPIISVFAYDIESGLNSTVIEAVLDFLRGHTCVPFVRNASADHLVYYRRSASKCSSVVGLYYGVQNILLTDNCVTNFKSVLHETMHALGMWHTQMRDDRDDYVTFLQANADSNYVYNFNKIGKTINIVPYDYSSIMHYNSFDFNNGNGGPTLQATIPQYQYNMGGRRITFYDLYSINRRYKCDAVCQSGATCKNGGYRNPANCQVCICPDGYDVATNCDPMASSCNGTTSAGSAVQTMTVVFGRQWINLSDPPKECVQWIVGPAGSKIEVKVRIDYIAFGSSGCAYGAVEVKGLSDHRYTGPRVCVENSELTLVSEDSRLPVFVFANFGYLQTTISYRTVPASTPSTIRLAQIKGTAKSY